jgi:hypothetical protein
MTILDKQIFVVLLWQLTAKCGRIFEIINLQLSLIMRLPMASFLKLLIVKKIKALLYYAKWQLLTGKQKYLSIKTSPIRNLPFYLMHANILNLRRIK